MTHHPEAGPMSALTARLDSAPRMGTTLGEHTMSNGTKLGVLDVLERLILAAQHPDIAAVERYGPGDGPWGPSVEQSRAKAITGIRVVHQSTATAMLWEAVWPGEQPVDPPAVWPTPEQNRAPRLLLFVGQLLEVAKPEQFQAWQLVSFPNLGNPATQAGLPFGLSVVTADGQRVLLRATATGPVQGFEPAEEPFPNYVIPEEVRTCLGSDTAKTNPCLPVSAVPAARS